MPPDTRASAIGSGRGRGPSRGSRSDSRGVTSGRARASRARPRRRARRGRPGRRKTRPGSGAAAVRANPSAGGPRRPNARGPGGRRGAGVLPVRFPSVGELFGSYLLLDTTRTGLIETPRATRLTPPASGGRALRPFRRRQTAFSPSRFATGPPGDLSCRSPVAPGRSARSWPTPRPEEVFASLKAALFVASFPGRRSGGFKDGTKAPLPPPRERLFGGSGFGTTGSCVETVGGVP